MIVTEHDKTCQRDAMSCLDCFVGTLWPESRREAGPVGCIHAGLQRHAAAGVAVPRGLACTPCTLADSAHRFEEHHFRIPEGLQLMGPYIESKCAQSCKLPGPRHGSGNRLIKREGSMYQHRPSNADTSAC